MGGWLRFSVATVATVAASVLGVFLASQGLMRASLWATALGLPLTVIIAVAGVWTAVLAAKTLAREPNQQARKALDTAGGSPKECGEPGNIRQDGTGGITIAHTGTGHITVTGPLAEDGRHDEPR